MKNLTENNNELIADMGLAILDGDIDEAITQGIIAINWYNLNK